jgi:hypothetical protein
MTFGLAAWPNYNGLLGKFPVVAADMESRNGRQAAWKSAHKRSIVELNLGLVGGRLSDWLPWCAFAAITIVPRE